MTVQLVGESIGSIFERGISQYPSINDEVHLVTETDLRRIYASPGPTQIPIGRLASAESMTVCVDLDKLITRHCAVLGSTGSGKSTTVASLLRSICGRETASGKTRFPRARILLLDIHGEYARALQDVSKIFRINPNPGESQLHVPFWALDPMDMSQFLFGGLEEKQATYIHDKIIELKLASLQTGQYAGVQPSSLTISTPVPYSLKRLWLELVEPELMTLEGTNRDEPAKLSDGDAETLTSPKFKPHGLGTKGPFLNQAARGIRRPLDQLRSRLLDRQYDFLLHPGSWEPSVDGKIASDLDDLLKAWLGHDMAITILDLSGVPSGVLVRLIGSILKIVYEALFWSREKSEGGIERPLLVVMEEAHRYLSDAGDGSARLIVQRIVKEGRKYGIGAMVVSQRPSEVDETILSQCGTFFALRLSNPTDRSRVQGTLPDSLTGLMDMLPILRTGEAIVTGEAAHLPLRCRINLPERKHRPDSEDPQVSLQWERERISENYGRVAASWRAQAPRFAAVRPKREPVTDPSPSKEESDGS
jgi:DNA helicase HerA-like ATPase